MADTIVSIHQPSYFAWLGLLEKIKNSDCYIMMDNVQLSDSAYQNRNIFLTNDGKVKYLNINISKKGYKDVFLKDLKISNPNWQKEHLNFLESNYKKHPYYDEVLAAITDFYHTKFEDLGEALYANMLLTCNLFDMDTKVMRQSEMDYNQDARKGDLVIELIKSIGYNRYYSGKGAQAYIEDDRFQDAGIELIYQDFKHPVYPQKNSPNEFIPGLSCLDLLFNVGLIKAKEYIGAGTK